MAALRFRIRSCFLTIKLKLRKCFTSAKASILHVTQVSGMMGDVLLPIRSPNKNQELVMINGIYHGKYSVGISLDKVERIQQFIFTVR